MAERFQLYEAAPVAAGATINKSDIPASDGIKVNDTVIDKEGYVYQVTAVAATTVTVGNALYRLVTAGDGVPHYYFETEDTFQAWLKGSETKPDHYIAMTKSAAQAVSTTSGGSATLEAVLTAGNTAAEKTLQLTDGADSKATLSNGSLNLQEKNGSGIQTASLDAVGLEFTNPNAGNNQLMSYGLSGITGTDENGGTFKVNAWRLLFEKTSAGTTSDAAVYNVKKHYKEYKIELNGTALDATVDPILTVNNVSTGGTLIAYHTKTADNKVTTYYDNVDDLLTTTEVYTGDHIMATVNIKTAMAQAQSKVMVLGTTAAHSALVEAGFVPKTANSSIANPSSFELKLTGAKMKYTLRIWGRD